MLSIVIFYLLGVNASCQQDSIKHSGDSLPGRFYVLPKVDRNGEVMPEVEIKEVTVVARPTPAHRSEFRKYQRLIDNIKKVYPYALMVRKTLNQVNDDLGEMSSERQRKDYMKEMEKKVFNEYEDDIRNMTFTQGKILIKLIDRETQNTSYNLIKDYRGKITAVFWQGIARIFGANLKDQYDRFGEDALIEQIIVEIDEGRL